MQCSLNAFCIARCLCIMVKRFPPAKGPFLSPFLLFSPCLAPPFFSAHSIKGGKERKPEKEKLNKNNCCFCENFHDSF